MKFYFGVRWMTIILVIAGVLLVLCGWQIFLKHKYDDAFERTRVGDSIDTVTAMFGKPSKIEPCPKVNSALTPNNDLSYLFPNCKNRYWYFYALSYLDLGA